MIVNQLSPLQWSELAEEAHLLCFNEVRDCSMDRIDFALYTTDGNKPLAYMTCKELDSETIYLQYGGSFPETQGTANSFRAYNQMLFRLKELGYKRAGTYIENTNKPMLKFAMKAGWLITGLRNFENTLLLEHTIKFGDK
jgi:hypothetical protein